jgi:hypothetical protein
MTVQEAGEIMKEARLLKIDAHRNQETLNTYSIYFGVFSSLRLTSYDAARTFLLALKFENLSKKNTGC